jgi:hypothetical protein
MKWVYHWQFVCNLRRDCQPNTLLDVYLPVISGVHMVVKLSP